MGRSKNPLINTGINSIGAKSAVTMKLYSYQTYVKDFPAPAIKFQITPRVALYYMASNNVDLHDITDMLVIKGFASDETVIGGSIYIAADNSTNTIRTIQRAYSELWIRPNVIGSNFSDPYNVGFVNIMAIAIKE